MLWILVRVGTLCVSLAASAAALSGFSRGNSVRVDSVAIRKHGTFVVVRRRLEKHPQARIPQRMRCLALPPFLATGTCAHLRLLRPAR